MKTAVKIFMLVLLLGTVSAVIAANLHRDPELFHFRWKLTRTVPLQVTTAPAERRAITHSIDAPGEVEADLEVEVSSEVMGRIAKLHVREGQKVRRGELLVQLDDADYQAEVRSGAARVDRLTKAIELIEADLTKSHRDVALNRKLLARKAIGATELADLETLLNKDETRLAMSKAELMEAEAMLAKAKENLADTTIRSTLDGVVSRLVAEEGETVVIGTMNNPGTVILVVSDLGRMVVRAQVDETDVPLVRPGQSSLVHLQFDGELPVKGTVLRVAPKGTKGTDPLSLPASTSSTDVATFETMIVLDDPPTEVRLGMTANVEIEVETRQDALVIPSQAVLHRRAKNLPKRIVEQIETDTRYHAGSEDPDKRYHQIVFVALAGKAVCRLVKSGISDETSVEIHSGVQPGDKVVTGPYRIFSNLEDGTAITEAAE